MDREELEKRDTYQSTLLKARGTVKVDDYAPVRLNEVHDGNARSHLLGKSSGCVVEALSH